MKFTNGYSKLGSNVVAVNRPVGHSCPVSCRFHPQNDGSLKNKCYMIRLEGMRPNVRKAAMANMESSGASLSVMLSDAHDKNRLVRLHVGGDFMLPDGRLDRNYIFDWRWALDNTPQHSPILCYTHVINIPALVRAFDQFPTFKLFASVHDQTELDVARRTGFTRFALALDEKHYEWGGDAWVERFGIKALVCPEQRGKIKDCGSCRYCWGDWKHGGHVAFVEHSQPESYRGKKNGIGRKLNG